MANAAANHSVAILADLWYYGEDGPCSRPPSMYNAMHDFERLSLKFVSTTGELNFLLIQVNIKPYCKHKCVYLIEYLSEQSLTHHVISLIFSRNKESLL